MDAHSLECLDFYRVREIVAGFAQCGLGRALAERIKPAVRVDLVRRWLEQVAELKRYADADDRGLPPFGGITDVRNVVKRCAPPLQVSAEELSLVGDTLNGAAQVVRYLANVPDDCPELKHLVERVGDFSVIGNRIRAVIDARGELRDDASDKLRRIRHDIARARDQIHTTVTKLLQDPAVRRLLQYNNHTFVNDRLVLPLRTECRGRLPGIIHRGSGSGATLFVEPAQAVELNNQISNLRDEETQEIDRILWELAHEIHINAEPILHTLDALAVLDLLAAKLRFAKAYKAICPELTDESVIHARQARHPILLHLTEQKRAGGEQPAAIVPIDYRIGDDFDLLVITGPNTGGKTITLKTIGLLSLMVQAGVPVPVDEGSRFGVFKRILIDIGDEQSMQQSLSTFSAHLTRQLDMLRKAGPNTLVLLDELGAGTDPDEGAAIGRAILDELLRQQCRALATTHIGVLKGFALARERAENGCVEFDSETLQPTYHLCIGQPGVSNAIAIAQRLGMPKRLIHEAQENVSEGSRALNAALAGTVEAKRRAETARTAAETARVDAESAQRQAESTKAALEKQHADFQRWVASVVHLQPGDAVRVRNFDRDGKIVRMRLEQQRAEVDVGAFSVEVPLGDVLPPQTPEPPPKPPRARPPIAATVRPKQPRPTPAKRDAAAHAAKPGKGHKPDHEPQRPAPPPLTVEQANQLQPQDKVYVKRFHRDGRVIRLDAPHKRVVVSVGLLEVEVTYDDLAMPQASAHRRVKRPKRSRGGSTHKEAPAPSSDAADASGTPPI